MAIAAAIKLTRLQLNTSSVLTLKIWQLWGVIAACMQYLVAPRDEYSRPTAVMLRHVYGAKDMTAIKAAQVIISQYGFLVRAAVITVSCFMLYMFAELSVLSIMRSAASVKHKHRTNPCQVVLQAQSNLGIALF